MSKKLYRVNFLFIYFFLGNNNLGITAHGTQKSPPNIQITFESQSGNLICKYIPEDGEVQTKFFRFPI